MFLQDVLVSLCISEVVCPTSSSEGFALVDRLLVKGWYIDLLFIAPSFHWYQPTQNYCKIYCRWISFWKLSKCQCWMDNKTISSHKPHPTCVTTSNHIPVLQGYTDLVTLYISLRAIRFLLFTIAQCHPFIYRWMQGRI